MSELAGFSSVRCWSLSSGFVILCPTAKPETNFPCALLSGDEGLSTATADISLSSLLCLHAFAAKESQAFVACVDIDTPKEDA